MEYPSLIILIFACCFIIVSASDGTQLIIVNNCKERIWPAILGNSGYETLNNGGFTLNSGHRTVVDVPKWWSGRIWARQGCVFDTSGKGSCETGDCDNQLECRGLGGKPPSTIVEATFGTEANPTHYYYDVSLVDGFNLPVSIIPLLSTGPALDIISNNNNSNNNNCRVAACENNINACCPHNLTVRNGQGRVVACKSACIAKRDDKYCCTGEYGSRETCRPSVYAGFFKAVCPRAYSYPYDEETGLKMCDGAKRYVVTFCPPT